MRTFFTLSITCMVAGWHCFAQVKSTYQYNTSMPYGTLDLRTKISSTNYYYLSEGKTFSFRETSGVRTDTYRDMTGWDSSPYGQGHLRHKNGSQDEFVMNYRLLLPQGYKSTYAEGYPLIVHLHGAVERANCYYSNCYHADFDYTVQENSPPAPKSDTHRLLNNDHNLNVGGKQYLAARNLAGSKLPNDPSLAKRAFPGFVLAPQMFNIWDSLQVQDMVRIVRLLAAKYNIDEDRIYIQGLSIGGYAVYEALKRASWLFAAGLPMSSVSDANIFVQNQQGRVAHVPLWIFQGGKDNNPTPAFTETIINNLKKAGAVPRYTLYTDLGHTVWNKSYAQTDYFSWMLQQSKANLHAQGGNLVIDKARNKYPTLELAQGFFAYQWERNGVILSATSYKYKATTPGTYRARFSRKANPTASQWNKWSSPVVVTDIASAAKLAASARSTTEGDSAAIAVVDIAPEEPLEVDVYPNPASADNLNLRLRGFAMAPVDVRIVDNVGRELYAQIFDSPALTESEQLRMPSSYKGGIWVLMVSQGERKVRRKLVVRAE